LPRAGDLGGKRRVTTNGYRILFRNDENVLKLIMVIVAQLCKYSKNL